MPELVLKAIGHLYCKQIYSYDAPRQSVLAQNNEGIIILEENCNYEQALFDLEGFERIWLIYQFHLNTDWKPKTLPPRSNDGKKKGTFATRSPYRPNPIGLSSVELIKIEKNKIYIRNFDLIDKTPILDIKPYIPYCDSFPESKAGWLDELKTSDNWTCIFSDKAKEQADWILKNSNFDLIRFCEIQLSNEPLNYQKKRIEIIDKEKEAYSLAYRTWRIHFNLNEKNEEIMIYQITSGYSEKDLEINSIDKYLDKDLHRSYIKKF